MKGTKFSVAIQILILILESLISMSADQIARGDAQLERHHLDGDIEDAIIHRNGKITFVFQNGTEIKIGA